MNPRRLVLAGLWRNYRPVLTGFMAVLITGVIVGDIIASRVTDPAPGMWMFFTTAFRYWLGIVGCVTVAVHLRQFVASGITRRDFLAGAALIGVMGAVFYAVVVPLGHGIEYALHGGTGFSASIALREFALTLISCMAAFVTGAAATSGFYRYGTRGGLIFLIPALLPAAVAEILFTLDGDGQLMVRFIPYPVAILVSLAVTALVGRLTRQELHEVAIRRSALG
ncbi:twin-arginine translocation signal domain-containing protein [Actinoplanes sp. NPDC051494]|uniref:twin-arginine translocation signal domain-containing protein n=1 Tax=Actinoplanes sp. NPDC051494 TaxID=3363907 RepID=UPI003791B764